MSEEALAKERDVKFKQWLQNKAIKEKAFEYMAKLSQERATKEESLIEVGVSLCAVDRILGGEEESSNKLVTNNLTPSGSEDRVPGATASTAKAGGESSGNGQKKSLKTFWMRWAMEFYSLSMLRLTSRDLASLSDAVKEFLLSEMELLVYSDPEEAAKASKEKNILPSLKYFFPAVPKANEKPRPLTNDQKAQNVIYLRELRKLWRKAEEEMGNRVEEYVARALKASADSESVSKERASKSAGRATDSAEDSNQKRILVKQLESQCLMDLSLRRMRDWIEQDEDEKLKDENEKAREKLDDAKKRHEQFVKKKDSLRIRMPDNITPLPTQPVSFGRDMSGIRAQTKPVTSTVELMAGMGLKYVHATGRGRPGVPGDLENSRNQLLKMGFVAKDNFDEGDDALYEREKRDNQVLAEKQRLEQKAQGDNAKAYEEWIVLKGLRDQASKCLNLLAKPQVAHTGTLRRSGAFDAPAGSDNNINPRRSMTSSTGDLSRGGGGGVGRGAGLPSSSGTKAQFALNLKDARDRDTFDRIVEVGKNLKRIDRTLFNDWATWCSSVIPVNIANVLWDFFSPRACDVHSSQYSQIRDSFLKLLRPGVDYRETFLDFVERNIFAKRISNFRDEKNYYRLEPEEKMDVDAEIESLRKEWLQDVSIPRSKFKALLAQMGIVLKDAEMRSLLDAFDANGDGVITLKEFLDFCGPKRDKRSGNSLILNQRCCWVTTCTVTGMPNGYSVSNATKRILRQEKEQKMKHASSRLDTQQDDADAEEESASKANSSQQGTGKMVIKKLANGEQRLCVELSDRVRREDLLRRLGLLASSSGEEADRKRRQSESANKKRHAHSPDGYGDDFEEDHDPYGDDFDQELSEQNPSKTMALKETKGVVTLGACEMSTWETKDRRKGIQYMLDLTKDLREEETLKQLIANGQPPSAPRCWIQFEKKLDTKSKNRFATDSTTDHEQLEKEILAVSEELGIDGSTEMVIFWAPQAASELVSFYSLEYAGPISINTKLGDAKYVEVFRDPPEADENSTFNLQYLMSNLTPGTSYLFRIRAFNGFGPSDYTYKTFTTLTNVPLQPRALKIAPESVILRWTFTANFFQRIEELKKLFLIADRDHSGRVDREELTAILNDRVEDSAPLKLFLDRIIAVKMKNEVGEGGGMGAQGFAGLFDMIESDDDGFLTWQEFENFFLSTGWANVTSNLTAAGSTMLGDNGSVTSNATGRQSLALNGGNTNIKPGDIIYVIEKCESEFDDTYKEVLRTTSGQAMVKGLEPGQSYRFRVYSMNADGLPGPSSPSVLVHTLLETPAAPLPANNPAAIQARSLLLSWKARNYVTNTRHKTFVENMMNDWTHAHYLNDGGVSIDMIFAKYDRNQSGDIDAQELALVLEDLGVDPTPERISAAFQAIDADQDGTISFEEFAKWWRKQEVTYILKRSDEIVPASRYAWSQSAQVSASNSVTSLPLAGENDQLSQSGRPRSASAHRRGTTSATAAVNNNTNDNNGAMTARSASRGAMHRHSGSGGNANISKSGKENNAAGVVYVNPVPHLNAASLLPTPVRVVAVPKVVFREGSKTRYEVKGLVPNNMYHFKVRYIGPRSNSMLSPPLVIMTAPLAPSIPVLIDVTSNTMRIKWYAAEFGCFKFVVQMRIASGAVVAGGTNNNNGTTKRSSGATLTGLNLKDGEGWYQVYLGQDNVYTCVTLASETAYEVRVFAVNYQGTLSESSPILEFRTLTRTDTSSVLTPKNAGQAFTVECTGDICVGDTVLITERLYLRPAQAMQGKHVQSIAVTGSIHAIKGISSHNNLASTTGKVTATAIHANAGKGKRSSAAATMEITSTRSGLVGDDPNQSAVFDGGVSITSVAGAFLGERTIAALVTKDNYRSSRDAMLARNIAPGVGSNNKAFGGMRRLWLEVVWQRSSNEEVRRYEAKPGEVIERLQSHLEEFEVFRVPWRQENLRKSLVQEWHTLQDCFVPMT
jgi:Ca2+-binding EF-hand superfamily protein